MRFWPFSAHCPIDVESQTWVNQRMKWLAGEFGLDAWKNAKAVEPTEHFFPDQYDQTENAVRRIFERVCGFMGVDLSRVRLQLYTEQNSSLARNIHLHTKGKGTAGHYRVEEKEIVSIETSNLNDPMVLVATIAHELAHVRLLGERRVNRDEEDHEPLTDLATVFFGLGIFNANSSFRFRQWSEGGWHGWRAARLGYLNEHMFGYALGLWATVRGEENPPWMKHLRVNPRTYMKRSIRYLKANPPELF